MKYPRSKPTDSNNHMASRLGKKISPTILIIIASLAIAAIAVYASDSATVNYTTTQQVTGPDGICKKITNNSGTGLSEYVPTTSTAEWQSFIANPPLGITLGVCSTAGSPKCYTTPGTYTFTIPLNNTLTVEVWGGGGGGGNNVFNAWAGTKSSWSGAVIANGGTGGNALPGAGGTASGGSTNITGNSGTKTNGGSAPNGGAGGVCAATGIGTAGKAPGAGGGAGGCNVSTFTGGGGSGGYSTITYGGGILTQGSSVVVVVGAGGAGAAGINTGGAGAPGKVCISWN